LPHACDERLAAIAKEKQEKKDKYEAEKKRINEHTDGQCEACRGTGYAGYNAFTTCQCCFGQCTFNRKSREYMLRTVRHKIWPSMKDHYGSKYRW
jgi:DnaJ-class molecular chaperone